MYKSEPKSNLTLITCANKVYEFKVGTIRPIGVLAPLESNFKVDLTSYYRESTTLQYSM